MKDIKDNSSKLSDLFDDLQETLDNSIFNEGNKENNPEKPEKSERTEKSSKSERFEKPEKPEKDDTIDGFFDALFDEIEKPEKPEKSSRPAEPPKKEAEIYELEEPDELDEIDELNELNETDEDDDRDNADMDLELLKAIGIGKASGYYPVTDKDGGEPRKKQGEKSQNEPGPQTEKKPPKKHASRSLHKISAKEYTNRDQINEIFASYRRVYKSEYIKLVAGIFFFLILLYMEIAPYLNWKMPNELNIKFYNLPYIYINLQILLIVAALNGKSLVYGIKSMFTSNINAYSVSVVFFLTGFAHTMATLYLRYNNPDIVLYNSIAVYGMVLTGVYNILDMNAEIASFKTVTSKKAKYALSAGGNIKSAAAPQPADRPYRSLESEAELFKDVVDYNASAAGVTKTTFISNFFSRTYKDKDPGGHAKYFVWIALFAAMTFLAFYTISNREKDWYVFLSSAAALILGSVPLCSFITYIYPVFKAQNKARAAGAAFIGGNSLEESADTAIISLYDKDIFPADKIKLAGIKVYGNNKIDEVVQSLCVVFDKLNMPPAETFIKSTTNFNDGFNKNIKFISIDDNGICYASNGRKLFLGTPEYISNMGLAPPYDPNSDDPHVNSSGIIMILASETEIIAKIYIKYEITPDFFDIVKYIKKINACLCIRTFDPNIDNALINKLGNIKKYPVRVLKLKNPEDTQTPPERMDSPVISKDSVKSLINAVLIAVRTKRVMKSNVLIQAVAFGVSVTVAVILGFTGRLWGINAGHLFILQSFWMLPVIFLQGLTR